MKSFALLLLITLVIACAPVSTAPPAAAVASPGAATAVPAVATAAPINSSPAAKGKLRINVSPEVRISNIPMRMALDALTEKGYQVEAVPIAQFSLVVPALVQGGLDVSTGSNITIWSAIAKGGQVRSIVGWTNNPYFIVTPSDIKDCAELNGKPVGIQSFRGLIEAELADYLARHCNNAEPVYLNLDTDDPRRAALEGGQIVGGRFELDDLLLLEAAAPGKYKPLIQFGKEYPDVQIASFVAAQKFIETNPELAKDFVLELLKAQRQIQDPEVLQEQIIKYHQLAPDVAEAQAKAYLAFNTWDLNGGLSPDSIQKTMDFAVQNKILAKPLTAEEVADFTFLNAALEEIGRK